MQLESPRIVRATRSGQTRHRRGGLTSLGLRQEVLHRQGQHHLGPAREDQVDPHEQADHPEGRLWPLLPDQYAQNQVDCAAGECPAPVRKQPPSIREPYHACLGRRQKNTLRVIGGIQRPGECRAGTGFLGRSRGVPDSPLTRSRLSGEMAINQAPFAGLVASYCLRWSCLILCRLPSFQPREDSTSAVTSFGSHNGEI